MIRRARKKPVEIEFVEYDGGNIAELRDWSPDVTWSEVHDTWSVRTLEGDMKLVKGDLVIKGVQGEFYPCKPDIFAATYEETA